MLSEGLRDFANPLALMELNRVIKICSDLMNDEGTQGNRTAAED